MLRSLLKRHPRNDVRLHMEDLKAMQVLLSDRYPHSRMGDLNPNTYRHQAMPTAGFQWRRHAFPGGTGKSWLLDRLGCTVYAVCWSGREDLSGRRDRNFLSAVPGRSGGERPGNGASRLCAVTRAARNDL